MQFEIILLLLGITHAYQSFFLTFEDDKNDEYTNRIQRWGLDRKPLNCILCVSFWLSIIFIIFVQEVEIMVVPLLYRIIQIKLLR